MKIRTGFVSNSSSSSFCICGYCWDYDKELVCEIRNNPLFKELGLEIYYDSFTGVNLGKSYSQMKDDETLKEFKNLIKTSIEKLNLSVNSYEDPYMILDEVEQ